MLEFISAILELTACIFGSFVVIGCVGYALGYGFNKGKKDCGEPDLNIHFPTVNVVHKTGEPPEED